MKKIIRLTESDLTKIVKRVIMEQAKISQEDSKDKEVYDKAKRTGCYTVQVNDTVLAIAKKFGITLDEIKSLNGMKGANSIKPGQKLRVQNRVKFEGC